MRPEVWTLIITLSIVFPTCKHTLNGLLCTANIYRCRKIDYSISQIDYKCVSGVDRVSQTTILKNHNGANTLLGLIRLSHVTAEVLLVFMQILLQANWGSFHLQSNVACPCCKSWKKKKRQCVLSLPAVCLPGGLALVTHICHRSSSNTSYVCRSPASPRMYITLWVCTRP